MQIKKELRAYFSAKRSEVADKADKDNSICRAFLDSKIYKAADEILCYCSFGSEIDTAKIISAALRDGKKLFLPKCTDKNGSMLFYRVINTDNLVKGTYGISEPDTEICEPAYNFENALCVVPGLSFDRNGHRLGYGKGYYDRFLEKFTIKSAGLCYNNLISDSLPAEKYDLPVDYIFTETEVIKV